MRTSKHLETQSATLATALGWRLRRNASTLRGGYRALIGVSALCFTIMSANGDVLKEARVSQVIKDVQLLRSNGAPRPATTTDVVRQGTAVRTGADSRAELTFTDLTIARMGANTIFSFDEGT